MAKLGLSNLWWTGASRAATNDALLNHDYMLGSNGTRHSDSNSEPTAPRKNVVSSDFLCRFLQHVATKASLHRRRPTWRHWLSISMTKTRQSAVTRLMSERKVSTLLESKRLSVILRR